MHIRHAWGREAGGLVLEVLLGREAGGESWPQVKRVGIVFGRWWTLRWWTLRWWTFYEDVYVSTVLCSIDDDVFPEREENRERCRTRVSFVFAMLSERGGETVLASR